MLIPEDMKRNIGPSSLATLIGFAACTFACGQTESPNTGAMEEPPAETVNENENPEADPTPRPTLLPSARATQISTGRLHACALTSDGAVRCWGYSNVGQIGNGAPFEGSSDAKSSVPVQVVGLTSGITAIATYGDFTCALTSIGGVKCWGEDNLGQLGTGVPYTDNRKQASSSPVDVKDLASGVSRVAVGSDSACAVLATGTVKCWGHDEYGKLGNDSPKEPGDALPDHQPPVDVVGLTDVVQISVGASHACALTKAGKAYCWGGNTYGQLGRPDISMTSIQKVPLEITALGTDAASIHAGARGTCALMKNGTARCWGSTEWGSIGNGEKGTIDSVLEPTPVLDLAAATAVTAPSNFTCALVSSGAVRCWGDSSALGLAEGPSYRTYKPAGSVVGLTDVVEIGIGTEYACARKSDGSVLCWGENGGGQLGDGKGAEVDTSARSDTPVAVASLP